MAMPSSEILLSHAMRSMVWRLPSRMGCAMASSTRMAAARMIFRSSPSGNTMRFCERTAEDEREPEDVVDLIGIVAASCGDDGIGARGAHLIRKNLGDGIGEREDDRTRCHLGDHLPRYRACDAEANEDVGTHECFGQSRRSRLRHEARLVRIQLLRAPAFANDTAPVAHEDVLGLHS